MSKAHGMSGTQQVGWGEKPATGYNDHALLWNSTAGSVVDLSPNGFTGSEALGTSGTQQVGYGFTNGSSTHCSGMARQPA